MMDKENASLMLKEEFPEVPFVGTIYGANINELEKDDILRAFKLAIELSRAEYERAKRDSEFKDFFNSIKLKYLGTK